MEENNQVAVNRKTVLVYSTVGKNVSQIETGARTWGELQADLNTFGIQYDKMKAVVGETKNTLESLNALLPQQEKFTLFLMPLKTKAGADLSYQECRTELKKIFNSMPDKKSLDEAKKFFAEGSRNWTQTSVEEMNNNLKKWAKKVGMPDSVKSAVNKVKEKLSSSPAVEAEENIFSLAIEELKAIPTKDLTAEEVRELRTIIEEVIKLSRQVTQRILEKQREIELLNELQNTARSLAQEFDDVQSRY